jgi:hypothetical protein
MQHRFYITKSKGGVDEGGDNGTTGDDEAVGELAAELATTGGGSDSSNAIDTTMGKGKLSRNRPTGLRYKLCDDVGRKSVQKHIKRKIAELKGFLVKRWGDEWQAIWRGGSVVGGRRRW